MRTPESYDYHCSLLGGDLDKENSITYGIRCRSALNRINDFHVVDHLPQDIMHVLFEGVVPYELSLLLTDFVNVCRYFTVDKLNDRMACFSYTNEEARDTPSPINAQKLNHLSQSCK